MSVRHPVADAILWDLAVRLGMSPTVPRHSADDIYAHVRWMTNDAYMRGRAIAQMEALQKSKENPGKPSHLLGGPQAAEEAERGVKRGKLIIDISTRNAAMSRPDDLVIALNKICMKLLMQKTKGHVRDVNGNTVGYFQLVPEDEVQ